MFQTLIDVPTLARHLTDPRWCVIDCRHDLGDFGAGARHYAASHLPGAHFARIEEDLSGPRTPETGRHPLPDPEALLALLRGFGVDDDTQVVAYDASGGVFASRLWWLVRSLGHASVAVLDGGWQRWLAEGGAVSHEPPLARPGTLKRRPPLTALVTTPDVEAELHRGEAGRTFLLVDARSPERYRGEHEPIDPVAGHIPGALLRPWQENLAPDGRFKEPGLLAQEFRGVFGPGPQLPVAHTCGSGVTACHNLLAMVVAGWPVEPLLYAGSFSEWIRDPMHPVVTGPAP
jgi:thiosulfate/3-mercaptopyruvate sulfurtransferase